MKDSRLCQHCPTCPPPSGWEIRATRSYLALRLLSPRCGCDYLFARFGQNTCALTPGRSKFVLVDNAIVTEIALYLEATACAPVAVPFDLLKETIHYVAGRARFPW